MKELICARGLGKHYERRGRTFWALRGAALDLSPGELVTILGRSGSGKSTFLNIAVGLLKPDEGEVHLCGKVISSLSDLEASRWRNETTGFVPQGAGVLPTLTALDNVRLPWHLASRGGEPEGRALELLGSVGLSELAGQYPSELSGGELQRVAIARALMNSPKLLVADEPTSNLDAQSAQEVVALFRHFADKGAGVLMVTHDPSCARLSDKIYDMEGGVLKIRTAP